MKCVALAGRQPVYELGAADLVVRDLSQLSFVNLKQLFAREEMVAAQVGCHLAVLCAPVARRWPASGSLTSCFARKWPAPLAMRASQVAPASPGPACIT
jgi:hypothetical protein